MPSLNVLIQHFCDDTNVILTTQGDFSGAIAKKLMIVSKEDWDYLTRVLQKLVLGAYLTEQTGKTQLTKIDANGVPGDIEECLALVLEQTYEEFPKLLGTNEKQVWFDDDMNDFLDNNKVIPDCFRRFLDEAADFYRSKQHPSS